MAKIKLMTVSIGGKKIGFSSMTGFVVQVAEGRTGNYKTIAHGKGEEFPNLLASYKGVAVGDGTRKRICMNGKVLVRGR